jgi:hypothetical protein
MSNITLRTTVPKDESTIIDGVRHFTFQQVSRHTGISVTTLGKHTKRGRLPIVFHRDGRTKRYVSEAAIRALFEQRPTAAEKAITAGESQ